MSESERKCDALIVGSGAAALVGALVVKVAGFEPIVVEKTDLIGGSSAMSGGGLWIPNNPVMKEMGYVDSFEAALTYLTNVVPEAGRATSPERIRAFLENGPKMVSFLSDLGFRWRAAVGYPDYYPEKPGGSATGRSIEGAVFDGRKLGEWLGRLRRYPGAPPLPIHITDAAKLYLMRRTASGLATALKLGLMTAGYRVLGRVPLTLGASLVGQLLWLCLQRGVEVWLNSQVVDLIESDGKMVGAVVKREGRSIRVRTRGGVLVASGGFERNQAMRERYLPRPTDARWTVGSPGNTGDLIEVAQRHGAQVALMDKAWGGPVMITPKGETSFVLAERSLPFGIIVDSSGERFMNESASYVDCWRAQYERHKKVSAIPAWLIIDSRHRSYYLFGTLPPGRTPESATGPGFLMRANTLRELGERTGVDPTGLEATVRRFNAMARSGKDEDFGRGDSAYDRYYSDPKVKPNPNLGPIEKPPYYATAIYPGDLGTSGGLLTDEHGRVLHVDGHPIEGLYAAGNASASPFGGTYPGPGSTLGPACTFAYIAMRHLVDRLKSSAGGG
ncbi:MAG: FAD-binding protein [Thaumarchaeota archaeon]|nr:FAD-binding protein [Candidatus Calditenuaceae archaeon]